MKFVRMNVKDLTKKYSSKVLKNRGHRLALATMHLKELILNSRNVF
jgi:hypothetical protein